MQYQIIETMHLGKTKYLGRVKLGHCYDQEQLVDKMVERNRSLSRETLTAALMVLKTTVTALCREGNAVRLDGFVRFSPTLGGTFDNHQDQFDAKRHTVTLASKVAKPINTQLNARLSMHRVESSHHTPQIFAVEDQETGTRDQTVTPGRIVSLRGQWLKFNPSDPRESLVFQNADDQNQVVTIPHPVADSSKHVYFVMPAVPFTEGVFVLTSTLGTTRPRTGTSLPLVVAPSP